MQIENSRPMSSFLRRQESIVKQRHLFLWCQLSAEFIANPLYGGCGNLYVLIIDEIASALRASQRHQGPFGGLNPPKADKPHPAI